MSVSIEAFQQNGILGEPDDDTVEHLLARGPEMFMSPADETGRTQALDDAVHATAEAGLPQESVGSA